MCSIYISPSTLYYCKLVHFRENERGDVYAPLAPALRYYLKFRLLHLHGVPTFHDKENNFRTPCVPS